MTDLPNAVRVRLKEADAMGHSGQHLDPNLLTALAEQTLLARERASVITHLARCGACREVAFLSLQQQPEMQTVALVAERSRPWWSLAALRWGAVAATAAVVVAAVMMRTPQPRLPMAKVESNARDLHSALPNTKEFPRAAKGQLGKATPPAAAPMSAHRQREKASGDVNEGLAAAESEVAASRQNDLEAAKIHSLDTRVAEFKEQDEKSLAPAVTAGAVEPSTNQTNPISVTAVEVTRQTKWLISRGHLLRLLNGDDKWNSVLVDDGAVLTTFWAFDPDIWVGGNGGALYYSSNQGNTWTRVKPVVDGTPLRADVTKLDFQDALHGTVITANGEKWVTKDGGGSWHLR